MECRDLLRFWPFPLFAAIVSPIILPAVFEVGEATATLISGVLTAAATAFVGYIAFRGLVVPVEAQRRADAQQVALALYAELTIVRSRSENTLKRLKAYADLVKMAEREGKDIGNFPHQIEVVTSNAVLHQIGHKIGVLPSSTVVCVAEAYAAANEFSEKEFNSYFLHEDGNVHAMAVGMALARLPMAIKKIARALEELWKIGGAPEAEPID